MTTLVQDLLPTIDDARQLATDLGLRLYRIFSRVRTWTGATQGAGTFSDIDTELLPRPRVRAQMSDGEIMPLDEVLNRAGTHFEGNLKIDRISPQTALATLRPNTAENQRQFFIVQGADGGEMAGVLYIADGEPIRRTTEWVIQLLKVEG